MKPKIILHVGLHKTGTTTFQRLIQKHSKYLAEEGVGIFNNKANVSLLKSIQRAKEVDSGLAEEFAVTVKKKSAKYTKFIISFEGLSGMYDKEQIYSNWECVTEILAQALSGYCVDVCAVFRRQDDFIQSIYTQLVQEGQRPCGVQDFVSSLDLECLNWNERSKRLVKLFGNKSSVWALPYDFEALRRVSLVPMLNSVISSVHLDALDESEILWSNASYSQIVIEVVKELFNRLDRVERSVFRKLIHKHLSKPKLTEHTLISLEEKIHLYEYFRESNIALAKRFSWNEKFGLSNFSPPAPNVLTKKDDEGALEIVFCAIKELVQYQEKIRELQAQIKKP